ncbi:MAG: hypothetical protein KBT36_01475 [Kurthia sp.]|nr:hypothetical protein [Candidatus Kurthia equi]
MAEKQIEKLQALINKSLKGEFISMLRKEGHFLSFCESSNAHRYALNVQRREVEMMIKESIRAFDYCTIFVNLKNGSLEIAKVA